MIWSKYKKEVVRFLEPTHKTKEYLSDKLSTELSELWDEFIKNYYHGAPLEIESELGDCFFCIAAKEELFGFRDSQSILSNPAEFGGDKDFLKSVLRNFLNSNDFGFALDSLSLFANNKRVSVTTVLQKNIDKQRSRHGDRFNKSYYMEKIKN